MVDGQLLLAQYERLVLLLDLVNQIGDQALQLLMRILDLLVLALVGEVATLLVLLELQDQLQSVLQLLLVVRLVASSLRAAGLLCLRRFLALRLLRLFLVIRLLLVVFASILHLGASVAVLIRVEVEVVRVLHILDHLLLKQEWVDGRHAHGCTLVGGSELLLLLLLLERSEHLSLRLRLRLMRQQIIRLISARRLLFLLALLLNLRLFLLSCRLMHLLLVLLLFLALLRHPLRLLLHLLLLLLVLHL